MKIWTEAAKPAPDEEADLLRRSLWGRRGDLRYETFKAYHALAVKYEKVIRANAPLAFEEKS